MARRVNYRNMSIADLTKTIETLTAELGRAIEALSIADAAKATAIQTLSSLGLTLNTQRIAPNTYVGLPPSNIPTSYQPSTPQLPAGISAADFDDMEVYVRPMEPGEVVTSAIPGMDVAPLAAPGEAVTFTNDADEIQRQIQARLEQLDPEL